MTQGERLCAASERCGYCYGLGYVSYYRARKQTCRCVYHRVFRECLAAYRSCNIPEVGTMLFGERCFGARTAPWKKVRPEEFRADFVMLGERELCDQMLAVFHLHYLEGRPFRECLRILRLNRGEFWHLAYLVERQAGRAIARMKPYSLWPVYRYFERSRLGAPAALAA